MSRVLAEAAGKLLTLLGYDGADFRNIHVDAAGDLQVDALSSALPAGAATEATLATLATEAKLELVRLLLVDIDAVDTRIEAVLAALLVELMLKADLTETQPVSVAALPLPAGAATSANQTTMITALQLIDDLRNALTSVHTDELAVSVYSSALPAGGATAARQDLLRAKFQDQAFTYKEQVYEKVTHNMVGAGSYTMTGAAVPADEIWVVSGVAAYDWNSALAAIYLGFDKAATQYWVAGCGAIAAKAAYNTYTPMYLVEGDKVAAFFSAATGGDPLAMMYNGYAMSLAP